MGKPVVSEFIINAYTTAYYIPLFLLAVVVAAPLSEEFLFRGFLFKGIERSRIGGVGTILISSLGWSALHIQYDLYEMGTVLALGLFLGLTRLKSNSIYLPVVLHSIWSLIAMVQTTFFLRQG
jgi:uncharacterized protein